MAIPKNVDSVQPQCRALAANAQGPVVRRAYLGVAEKWEALATEIEQAKMVLMAVNMVWPKSASESAPKDSSQNPSLRASIRSS